jgi:hypothetical protein
MPVLKKPNMMQSPRGLCVPLFSHCVSCRPPSPHPLAARLAPRAAKWWAQRTTETHEREGPRGLRPWWRAPRPRAGSGRRLRGPKPATGGGGHGSELEWTLFQPLSKANTDQPRPGGEGTTTRWGAAELSACRQAT